MTKDAQDLKKGDDISWKYGQGHPKGTVEEVVTDGQAETTTKKGNTLKKSGDDENPAVVIKAATGNNAIKKASEIDGVN